MLRTKPLNRKVPPKPGKPMKAFRKERRPGNKPMTAVERIRVMRAKEGPCIPCLVWARAGRMPMSDIARFTNEYDHKKSGNIRRGHAYGYAACLWHHRGRVSCGWNHAHMRAHFGPSLMDGSRLFHDTYGDDDSLIAIQNELLGIPSEEAA